MQEKKVGAVARRPHKLTPNRKNEYPIRYIFFDTETKQQTQSDGSVLHTLKLGWVNFYEDNPGHYENRDEWMLFHTSDEFWSFLESHAISKKRTLVFAHNADFDMQVVDFLNQLEQRGYETKKQIIDSGKFILQARKNKHTFLFLDTSNYCGKISLKSLAQSLGMEKMECDPLTAPDEELIPYCHRDVEIVREYVLRLFHFAKSEDLGNFAMTAAGIAFNAYRHRFMRQDIFIHNNIDAVILERAAYRGGRCECFFIGKAPDDDYYYLDVNSMYPFVMSQNSFPRYLIKTYKNVDKRLLLWALNRFAVIAELEIELSEPALGIHITKLIFPIGRFKGTFTSPEIEYVLAHGKILSFGPMAIYEKSPIFAGYVNYFYDKRLEYIKQKDSVSANFCKLCLNSLYGKFGQRSRKVVPARFSPPSQGRYSFSIDLRTHRKTILTKIGDTWFEESTEEEGYNSFVAIPAFVTAYARMYLWKIIQTAGLENVFYCDTDSVFVNSTGFDRLKNLISDSKELGKLGIKDQDRKLEIYGSKMYFFGQKIRIKGISRPEGFQKEYQQTRFIRLRTALRKGVEGGVLQVDMKKVLSYNYDKGQVSPSGRVSPLVLSSSP